MKIYNIRISNPLRQTLEETLVIIRIVSNKLTKAKLLVPSNPEVIIFMDASKEGVGGTIHWLDGSRKPLVFRFTHT